MSTFYSLSISLFAWPHLQLLPALLVLFVLVAFVGTLVANHYILKRVEKGTRQVESVNTIMQQALQMSANNVMRYDLHDQHVYQLFGHLYPEGGLSLEEWKAHVHPDDLDRTLMHFLDIMAGKEQRQEFYYRWNLDYSGGEPKWVYLHDVSVAEYRRDRHALQSIVSTLKDETLIQQEEQRENELGGKYRLIFENSLIGLSFYNPDGWLLDANARMRELCHFDSEEGDAFFSKTNLFDLAPFSEVIDRQHPEEFWACSQSIIPERDLHDYLEIRLHPICDEQGQLMYLAISARNVSEERQMYLQAKLNDAQIRQANVSIQHYEMELRYLMENCHMGTWRASFERREIDFYKGLSDIDRSMTFDEFQSYFIDEDGKVADAFRNPYELFSKPVFFLRRMHPMFGEQDNILWVQINSIPEYDDHGKVKGAFGLLRNVTDIMQKQEQLKRETERANDSGRLKSVFLANMTHEIRTPLNAIVGFSDLLQAIDAPEEKREMIRIIHNNCDMLLRLIDDILLLANADNNAMELIPADVDAAREFDTICQTLSQRVQPPVEFVADNPYESCETCLDSARIHQVVTNFVTNAVKYTTQGHVRLGYRVEERQGQSGLYFYCEDTGSGIPEDQRERIFERFVKLNDYIQGTGLGLSICKVIIEKSGGQIGVDSEVGKGSTFWFWIPVEIRELKVKS